MSNPDHTTNPALKRCSSHKRCVHPDGPWLPRTPGYFSRRKTAKDGLDNYCKECCRAQHGAKKRANKFPPAPEGFKYCGTCKEPKLLEEFHKDKGKKDGLSSSCKECAKTRAMDWHSDNRDEHCASMRQFKTEHPDTVREYRRRDKERHPDRDKEKNRRFRQEHPEEYKAAKKREYEKNSHKYILRVKNWRKNTEKGRASRKAEQSKRHAREHEAEGEYTSDDLVAQFKRQKGRCYWCGKKMDPRHYEPDHVIPLARGGDNWPSNIVCSHPHCNHSKGGKLPHEWNGSGGKLL